MQEWIKTIGGDVRSTLVGAVTLALVGSLLGLCVAIWTSMKDHSFQWNISVGIGIIGVTLSLIALAALALSSRKQPELTPFLARITAVDEQYRLTIGVKNEGKVKALDTRITAIFWRCSGNRTPFAVRESIGNPISTTVSQQIELEFTMEPVESVFVTVSFAYRNRPNSKLKEQRPAFYYKWNGVDSDLVHASGAERERIVQRLKDSHEVNADEIIVLGKVGIEPVKDAFARQPPEPSVYQHILTQTIAHAEKSAEEHRLRYEERVKQRTNLFQQCVEYLRGSPQSRLLILALIKCNVATALQHNEDLVWICDRFEKHGHGNPFGSYMGYVPKEDWLSFLQHIAWGTVNLRGDDTTVAAELFGAADEWRERHGYAAPPGFLSERLLTSTERVDKTRVGFLQLDRLTYHRKKAFEVGKHFTVTPSFRNRGQFPVYEAQVYALLVYWPIVTTTTDVDACRELRRLVEEQWKNTGGSQVAVDGSIYFPTSVESMSREQIDRLVEGKSRIYRITRARWKNDLGERITPEWDECSCLERPPAVDVNSLELAWRICDCLV